MRKRLLSILLACCLLAALPPVGASAAPIVDSGTCGDNVTWTYDGDGTLTISGAGKMADFADYAYKPWVNYRDDIKTIIIGDAITGIGDYAFSACRSLTSVSIPSGASIIGEYAFAFCTRLQSVSIPASVTRIGSCAFYECAGLEDVYYGGTAAQWSAIAMGSYNNYLADIATIYYGDGSFSGNNGGAGDDSGNSEGSTLVSNVYGSAKARTYHIPYSAEALSNGYTISCYDGNTYRLTDFSEEYVALIYGRTACGNTLAILKELYNARQRGFDVKIVLACVDYLEGYDTEEEFSAKYPGVVVSGGDGIYARNSGTYWSLRRECEINGDNMPLPVFVLLNADRKIVFASSGPAVNWVSEYLNTAVSFSDDRVDLYMTGTADYGEAFAVLEQLNDLRGSLGLSPLVMDAALLDAAMQRAAELLVYYGHDRPDGSDCSTALSERSIYYTSSGENIAAGQSDARRVMDAWTNSPGHYKNMVGESYTAVGIGCFYQGNGSKCWVQIFTGGGAIAPVVMDGQYSELFRIPASPKNIRLALSPAAATIGVGESTELVLINTINNGANLTNAEIYPSYSVSGDFLTASAAGNTVTGRAPGVTTVRIGADENVYAEATITVTGTVSQETHTVTFDPNGGSVGRSGKTVTNGEAYGALPAPSRDGYDFTGWYTRPDGGTEITSDTVVALSADQTLYAHWEKRQEDGEGGGYDWDMGIIAGGDCGAGLTWTLDENGTLYIEGEGAMDDYYPDASDVPWYDHREDVVVVYIDAGVTGIGNMAFYACDDLAVVFYMGDEAGWDRIAIGFFNDPLYDAALVILDDAPADDDAMFSDVDENDYFYDAVIWAVDYEITYGMGDGTFGSGLTVTRGQAMTFLWRAAGEPEPESDGSPFEDVHEEDYYYRAVLWAVEEGITAGTDETHFTPEQTCSTAHIVTFLYRTFNPGANGWYEEARDWAAQEGLLEDMDVEVSPDVDCIRANVVTFLYRKLG